MTALRQSIMTTIFNCAEEEDAYTCGVCGHNFKANDDIVIFADKQGRACCEYCPDEAEEEEVCDDEQRSYGARGAPAPERERKNYEELVAPIIAPKLACADCGQVETECRLELVGGKVMCCDCLDPKPTEEEDDDETETDDEEEETVVCPRCDRTEEDCEKNKEGEKNPITDWCGEWGLSCDDCYYKNHPESDEDDDASSVNTQEVCCECDLTEKQYNQKKGYEENLSTLHYIGGKTYCPDCRDPENSDDEESVCDDECDCCGENFAKLNTAEDAEGEKETYCDGCWKDKIEDGCVWKDENGEWVC